MQFGAAVAEDDLVVGLERRERPGLDVVAEGLQRAEHLAELQRTIELRVTHMVHDVIPTAHPQWAATGASAIVTPYLQTMMRICTTIIAVSESTRTDVERLTNTGVFPNNPNGRLLTLAHGHDPLAARGSATAPAGIAS